MSSGISPPPLTPEVAVLPPPTDGEVVIDRRLRQTQRQVKGVDIATGLVALAIGVLSYLLAVAIVDHWLVAGGLGSRGRFLLCVVLLGFAGTYFVRRVLPPLLRRINPLYAAATIEKSQPSLKNSLINFLLLRGHRREVATPVYQAIERQAATDLTAVEIEVAVDRSRVIRLGFVLACVLAAFCLYLVVSPKNPFRSAARVLLPWASIEAPTRVTIRDVRPGDDTVFHGDSVMVSADVAGLRQDEPVVLVYSTADDQLVHQSIPMTPQEGGYRYQCQLPPGNIGLQQDHTYYLAAGDCRTTLYRITTETAPAIVVDSVTYHYPAYTGLADLSVPKQGDLSAVEGTEVTIHATANTEIKPGTAEIDLGCTGRPGVRMSVDGRAATGTFTLRLDSIDPSRGEYDCYQLRFTDLKERGSAARESLRLIRYRISVTPDRAPEVQVVEPQQDEVSVPVDGKIDIKVRAEDIDFALRRVALHAEFGGKRLSIKPLLDRQKPEAGWSGPFEATYDFRPTRFRLNPGDAVEYWAEADDNKEPEAGRSATRKQRLLIAAPQGGREDAADQAKGNQGKSGQNNQDRAGGRNQADHQAGDSQNEQPSNDPTQSKDAGQKPDKANPSSPQSDRQDSNASDSKSDQGKDGEKSGQGSHDQQSDGQQQGEQLASADKQQGESADTNERVDPDTDPGGAMEKILKDREEQQEGKEPSQENSSEKGGEKSDGKQSGSGDSGQQQGEQQKGGGKADSPQQNSEKGDGQKADGKSSGDKSADAAQGNSGAKSDMGGKQQDPQNKPADAQETGGERPKDGASGGDAAGVQKSDPNQGGGKEDAEKSGANEAGGAAGGKPSPSSEKSGDGKQTAQQSGNEAGEQKLGNGKPSNEKTTSDDQGPRQDGDVKSGTEKATSDTLDASKDATDKSGTPQGTKQGQGKEDAQRQADEKKSAGTPSGERQQAGDGRNVGNNQGSPKPQESNTDRQKQAGKAGETPGERKGEPAQSPGTSKKQSDSKGDTAGDRAGGGEQGGGQQANKPGVGSGGSNTAADEGAGKASEQGEGETGTKAGDQTAGKEPTGSSAKQTGGTKSGPQTAADAKAGGKTDGASDDGNRGTPSQDQTAGGKPGNRPAETAGTGPKAHTGGDKPGDSTDVAPPPEAQDTGADDANMEYAQRQSTLALEHLRDQLAKEKPKVLDELGWSKEDARRFLDRWESMRRAADEQGPTGEVARKQLKEAVQSLGLRPGNTQLRRGVTADRSQTLRDASRFAPPPGWAEQVRQYSRGLSEDERQGK